MLRYRYATHLWATAKPQVVTLNSQDETWYLESFPWCSSRGGLLAAVHERRNRSKINHAKSDPLLNKFTTDAQIAVHHEWTSRSTKEKTSQKGGENEDLAKKKHLATAMIQKTRISSVSLLPLWTSNSLSLLLLLLLLLFQRYYYSFPKRIHHR